MTLGEEIIEGVISDVAGNKIPMLEWRGQIRSFFGPVRLWFKCPDLKGREPFDHLHKKVRLRLVLETIE